MSPRRLLRGCRRALALAGSALRIGYLRAAFPGFSAGFDSFVGPGCDIYLGPGAALVLRRVVIGRGCVIQAAAGARIEIAAHLIGPYSVLVAHERITIGEGSAIAEMAVVRDFDYDRRLQTPLADRKLRVGAISIGRDVFVGARCTILRGVTIGDWATIGTGSVVLTDVAPHTTVFGVPARPVVQRKDATC